MNIVKNKIDLYSGTIEFEQNKDGKDFNIKEICELVEMSNVSTKKYLDYLEKIKYIEEKTIYGNIGRPQCIYKKIDK